eukprot:9503925-Pyramimonas_sp.AAC.1
MERNFEAWVKCMWPRAITVFDDVSGCWTVPPPKPASDWDYANPMWSALVAHLQDDESQMEYWWGTLFNDGFLSLMSELEDHNTLTSEMPCDFFELAQTFHEFYIREDNNVLLDESFTQLLNPFLRAIRGVAALTCSFPFVFQSELEDVDFLAPPSTRKPAEQEGVATVSFDVICNSVRTAKLLKIRLRSKEGFWKHRLDEYKRVVGAEATMGLQLLECCKQMVELSAQTDLHIDFEKKKMDLIPFLQQWIQGAPSWTSNALRENATASLQRHVLSVLDNASSQGSWDQIQFSEENRAWIQVVLKASECLTTTNDTKPIQMRIKEMHEAWVHRSAEEMLASSISQDIKQYSDFKSLYDAVKGQASKNKEEAIQDKMVDAAWRALNWLSVAEVPWAQAKEVSDMLKLLTVTDTAMKTYWETRKTQSEALAECGKIALSTAVCIEYSSKPDVMKDLSGKGPEISSAMLTAYKKLSAVISQKP